MLLSTLVGVIFLVSAPCPAKPGVYGCTMFAGETPSVYIDPSLNPHGSWRESHTYQHELGHVKASHIPGASIWDENFAEHYSTCHDIHYRWLKRVLEGNNAKTICQRWGVR